MSAIKVIVFWAITLAGEYVDPSFEEAGGEYDTTTDILLPEDWKFDAEAGITTSNGTLIKAGDLAYKDGCVKATNFEHTFDVLPPHLEIGSISQTLAPEIVSEFHALAGLMSEARRRQEFLPRSQEDLFETLCGCIDEHCLYALSSLGIEHDSEGEYDFTISDTELRIYVIDDDGQQFIKHYEVLKGDPNEPS